VKQLAWLLVLLALTSACDRGAEPRFVARPAPDFAVQDGGRKVALSDLRGKVVVLNFWATWCPPCVDEMPSLVRMQQSLRANDVVVLAVSVDVDEAIYRKFLNDYNVHALLTVRDPDQVGAKLYGTTGFPETFIIDRQGVVLRKLVGPIDWTSPEMTKYLLQIADITGAPAASAANSR
jgi:thiol-disulfide isomerase/thioredoxin